ncbi:MAG: hypothetical protein AAGK97_02505 [Bacteroidota bacterium]
MQNQQKILKLFGGIFFIFFFVFYVSPIVLEYCRNPVTDSIQKEDIDASALFYSDSEAALEANYYLLID